MTMVLSPLDALLTRAHVAALRAWLQGVPLDDIVGRWLAPDPDKIPTSRQALATLHAVRDALQQRARLHGREDLAQACSSPSRSGKGMDRAITAVRELEALGTPAILPDQGVHLWLAGPLARRLQEAGIQTLADLVTLCNQRGRSWWRHVPRIGPLAAQRIVAVLVKHADALGQLGAHVTGAQLPVPAMPSTLQPGMGTAMPFEAMRLPAALDGRTGRNRAPLQECVIAAQHDYQAIQTWLSLWPEDSQTYRAYRKEAERFLAWIILDRGTAFSDAITDDCMAYRSFLADPQPAGRWRGPRVPRTVDVGGLTMNNPAWRPFSGPLSARSRSYSETVLSSLFAWLAGRRYLATNPWDGLPKTRNVAQTLQVEKAVRPDVWHSMADWLDEQAIAGPRARLWRAAVLLLRETGMRCDEAARAHAQDLVQLPQSGQLATSNRCGANCEFRGKVAGTPCPCQPASTDRAISALVRSRVQRSVARRSATCTPAGPNASASAQKVERGRSGYSDRACGSLSTRPALHSQNISLPPTQRQPDGLAHCIPMLAACLCVARPSRRHGY